LPIDDSIRLLGLKTGQPITEDWYDHLVDTLLDMADNSAISYDGAINKSLYPNQADAIQIGSDNLELKSIFTRDINISGYAKVSDLEVINDEIVDGDLYVYGGLDIPKTANIKEIVSDDIFSGNLYVYNNIYSNDLYVSKDLVVMDNATIHGLSEIYEDLIVGKSLRVSGDSYVDGYSYISKGLSVGYDIYATKVVSEDLISDSIRSKYGNIDYLDSIDLDIDNIVADSVYTNKLYSGYLYVSNYIDGYKAVLHELSLDVLDIYSEINLPDYSIGFIKLSPSLIYNKIRYLDIPASTQVIIPRGVYYANIPSGVTVDANFNGVWVIVLSSPGLIISDGENLRVNNSNTYSVTVELLMIA